MDGSWVGRACPAFIRWLIEVEERLMKGGIIVGFLAFLIVGIVLVLVLGDSGMSYRTRL